MLPGVYLFGMVIPLPAFFSAKRLLWINFFGTLICLLLILVLDLWLIPIWGGNGAALANSVAYSVAAIFLYYNFNLKTNTSIRLFFSWNTIETKKILKSFFNK
jgi:O-antigen/teichoic acid export membrane protein